MRRRGTGSGRAPRVLLAAVVLVAALDIPSAAGESVNLLENGHFTWKWNSDRPFWWTGDAATGNIDYRPLNETQDERPIWIEPAEGHDAPPSVRFADLSPVVGIMTQFLCYRRDPHPNPGYGHLGTQMPPMQWETSPLTLRFWAKYDAESSPVDPPKLRIDVIDQDAADGYTDPPNYSVFQTVGSESWTLYSLSINPGVPLTTLDVRLGLGFKTEGVEVLVDDVSLTDELEWEACDPLTTPEAITGSFPIKIEDDGWFSIAGNALFPSIMYLDKHYADPCEELTVFRSLGPYTYHTPLPCDDEQGTIDVEGRGFDAVVVAPSVDRVYASKRELEIALENARCVGLRGVAWVPLYPFNGDPELNKFPMLDAQIEEWAAHFELHAGLAAWIISDEMSDFDVQVKAVQHPVTKLIHDAEKAQPPVRWHPTIGIVCEEMFRAPKTWDLIGDGNPGCNSGEGEGDEFNRLWGCTTDVVHVADVLAPNAYPLVACYQEPRADVAHTVAQLKAAIRFCEHTPDHPECLGGPPPEEWAPRALAPMIQVFPFALDGGKMPNPKETFEMAAQAIAQGATSAIFYRSVRAEDLSTTSTGLHYDLLDGQSRIDWDQEQTCMPGETPIRDLWEQLPEINVALHDVADMIRQERPQGTRQVLFGPGEEGRAKSQATTTDTYVDQGMPITQFGNSEVISAGQRNYKDTSVEDRAVARSFIRFETAELPDLNPEHLERAYLRLLVPVQMYNQRGTASDEGGLRAGPLRLCASTIPADFYDWQETGGTPEHLDWETWMNWTKLLSHHEQPPGYLSHGWLEETAELPMYRPYTTDMVWNMWQSVELDISVPMYRWLKEKAGVIECRPEDEEHETICFDNKGLLLSPFRPTGGHRAGGKLDDAPPAKPEDDAHDGFEYTVNFISSDHPSAIFQPGAVPNIIYFTKTDASLVKPFAFHDLSNAETVMTRRLASDLAGYAYVLATEISTESAVPVCSTWRLATPAAQIDPTVPVKVLDPLKEPGDPAREVDSVLWPLFSPKRFTDNTDTYEEGDCAMSEAEDLSTTPERDDLYLLNWVRDEANDPSVVVFKIKRAP